MPQKVRIIVEMTVVAAIVILVDQIRRPTLPDVQAALGLRRPQHHQLHRAGRIEAFSMGTAPFRHRRRAGDGLGDTRSSSYRRFFPGTPGFGKISATRCCPGAVRGGLRDTGPHGARAGGVLHPLVIIWLQRSISGYARNEASWNFLNIAFGDIHENIILAYFLACAPSCPVEKEAHIARPGRGGGFRQSPSPPRSMDLHEYVLREGARLARPQFKRWT